MKDKLIEILPEFLMIKESELMDKVINVWQEAINEGGWSIEDLESMPFTHTIKNCPVSIIDHTRAVTKSAHKSAVEMEHLYKDKLKINNDVVIAGALLHNTEKLLKYKKEGNNFILSSSGKSIRDLSDIKVLADKFNINDEMLHCIENSSNEGDSLKRTAECIIINKADLMNFEVVRCFYE